MIGPEPICFVCKHFQGEAKVLGYTCKAFKIIPAEIMGGVHDHRRPFAGDGGVLFEAMPGAIVPPLESDEAGDLGEQST